MLGDIKLMQLASALTRHSADRHQLIAQNIANADTQGYKAKDLEPFADAMSRMDRSARHGVAAVRAAREREDLAWRISDNAISGAPSPNGNTVSLEDQMMRSVETQQNHEAATTIYRKAMEILRASMRSNA